MTVSHSRGHETSLSTRRSSKEVRARLLGAARQLLVERGDAQASTRDIARRAGVVEPALFRHFGNKAGLLEEVFIESFAGFLDGISDSLEGGIAQARWPQCARQWVARTHGWLDANRELLRALRAASAAGVNPSRRLPKLLHGLFLRLQSLTHRLQLVPGEPRPEVFAAQMLCIRLTFGLIASTVVLEDWLFASPQQQPPREALLDGLSRYVVGGWLAVLARPDVAAKPVAGGRRRRRGPPALRSQD
jgi:AcrR family transcriptional regulator